ncbi:DNA-binding response regulator [Ectothiorhodospiraceae bacterium BW-2]|nr:DNA-binding response regulator [Ectothiorhodospiraceae bacterium BW-2]
MERKADSSSQIKQLIRTLLVDDQLLTLDAMELLLHSLKKPKISVVGRAVNGIEAIQQTMRLKPDLILMDLLMPVMNGGDAAYQISRRFPDIRILMLTGNEGLDGVVRTDKLGAHGYALKTADKASLSRSIISVMCYDGEFVRPDYILEGSDSAQDSAIDLTRREQQILKMVAEGLTSKEIAEKISISIRTVQKHRENIMRKLEYPTMAKLIKIANQLKLIIP